MFDLLQEAEGEGGENKVVEEMLLTVIPDPYTYFKHITMSFLCCCCCLGSRGRKYEEEDSSRMELKPKVSTVTNKPEEDLEDIIGVEFKEKGQRKVK